MRLIQWSSQERVDLPDMIALSSNMLGEFRRTMRDVLMGEHANRIIRGFTVVATGTPDKFVHIAIDRNPSLESTALLSELVDTTVNYGQLAGGTGFEGLEGNASLPVDFTSLPANTYYVEVAFTYTPGVSANRGQWNPSSNTESIVNIPTRVLPTFATQLVTSPSGGQWAALATVVWGGGASTITSGNITNKQSMPFEGDYPYYATSQASSGGMADFDRSATRSLVATDEVYQVLRRLGRQVQDIKGADLSGHWNTWSRPVGPMDPSSLLSAQQTKGISTLDTQEYVVGDGVNAYGDFNGTTGLQACLTHIANSEAGLPTRIRIRLKGRTTGTYTSGTALWSCSTRVSFATLKHIQIIGDSAQGDVYGRVPVAFTHGSGPMFNFAAGGSLSLVNILQTNVSAFDFFHGFDAKLNLNNALLVNTNGTYVCRGASDGMIWSCSQVTGAVNVFISAQQGLGFYVANCTLGGASIYSTNVDGYFRTWADSSYTDSTSTATRFLGNGCFFCTAFDYSANALAASSTRQACIDARGLLEVIFDQCTFFAPADSNGVQLGTLEGVGVSSRAVHFKGCDFGHASTVEATHDSLSGYNGNAGTGWSVYAKNVPDDVTSNLNLQIREITFDACLWSSLPACDAGAIGFEGTYESIHIRGCHFEGAIFPNVNYGTNAPILRTIRLLNTDTGGAPDAGASIQGCFFGRCETAKSTATFVHIHVQGRNYLGVNIDDIRFRCTTHTDASAVSNWVADFSYCIALDEWSGSVGFSPRVVNMSRLQFHNFNSSHIICVAHLGGTITQLDIAKSNFNDSLKCVAVNTGAAGNYALSDNLYADNATYFFNGSSLLTGARVQLKGNRVSQTQGSPVTQVMTGACDHLVLVGNDFGSNGIVDGSVVPAESVGWNTTPALNIVNSFT